MYLILIYLIVAITCVVVMMKIEPENKAYLVYVSCVTLLYLIIVFLLIYSY